RSTGCPARHPAESQAFWGSLCGWKYPASPVPFEYHMSRIGAPQGAAVTNMEAGKRGTRPYFDVDDMNAGAGRVRELGGEAGEPMPVPSMGWFATCTDPHGNEFGLWQTDPNAPAPS